MVSSFASRSLVPRCCKHWANIEVAPSPRHQWSLYSRLGVADPCVLRLRPRLPRPSLHPRCEKGTPSVVDRRRSTCTCTWRPSWRRGKSHLAPCFFAFVFLFPSSSSIAALAIPPLLATLRSRFLGLLPILPIPPPFPPPLPGRPPRRHNWWSRRLRRSRRPFWVRQVSVDAGGWRRKERGWYNDRIWACGLISPLHATSGD